MTLGLIERLRPLVDRVVLVDDKCPLQTGKFVESVYKDPVVTVLYNEKNRGVGYSTIRGFKFLIEQEVDVLVKIDADGQMNPDLIPELIKPLVTGKSEGAKGNRFGSIDHLEGMPWIRMFGNLVLSFINKLSSGYWELFDPTNGFIAFKTLALKRVRLDKVNERYFFESDLLFQCGLAQVTFSQLNIPSYYGAETSSLRPLKESWRFLKNHAINFVKRLVYQYFLLDFNIGSLEILGSFVGLSSSLVLGLKILISRTMRHQYATSGESALFAIISIVTIQLLLSVLYYDATFQPLMRKLRNSC